MTTPSHAELMPSNSSISYPRAFLLSIYNGAVAEGFIYIEPVKQADYPSLRAQFYRLRRRADTSNKSFIIPEHHLVTLGPWEPGPSGRGRCAASFDKMPEGVPTLTTRAGDVLASAPPELHEQPAIMLPPAASLELTPSELQLDEGGIDDFVSRMMKNAKEAE